jgi:DNA-binding MarR family transcriptional regulator
MPNTDDMLDRDALDLTQVMPVQSRPVLSAKQRRQRAHFIKVPLDWAEQATKAISAPKAFVVLWLLYRAWKSGSPTVPLSNRQLEVRGVHRKTKHRALKELEAAGLIKLDRRRGRAPVVTLLHW